MMMSIILKTIFWGTFILTVYTYFGYPVCLRILHTIKKTKKVNKNAITPFLSIVIPAYNEEDAIAAKLDNILSLDYPSEKREIVVASDASEDNTDAIVQTFSEKGVRLCRLEKRGGKIAAYRQAMAALKGDIIVFSDATGILEKDSLRQLMKNFNDPSIGCVGGRLKYIPPEQINVGEGEQTYWQYENQIKIYESDLSSLTSVSGTFYAVRKHLYPIDIPKDLADDLIVPLNVKKKGFCSIIELNAICQELTVDTGEQEVKKRSRITVQNIRGLMAYSEVLNIFKYGLYAWMLLSHKVFRLLSPLFLLLMLELSLWLSFYSLFFQILLYGQFLFYGLGIIGYFWKKNRPKILNKIYYLCLSNYAIFLGILKYLSGKKMATWETAR